MRAAVCFYFLFPLRFPRDFFFPTFTHLDVDLHGRIVILIMIVNMWAYNRRRNSR